ncbi:hypothetical protein [Daejeonella sp.]|uniref:hypothetical protein n=1 Tax=Daejeonella sp. TaxID=2805397 RepID=UPI0039832D99
MKKILLCLLFSFVAADTKAQKMSLDIIGTAPDFNYTTISDYENQKVANNAIRLNIDAKKKNYQIDFRSDGPIKTSSGQSIPAEKFSIRIHNTIPLIPLSATNDQHLISVDRNDKDGEIYYLDFIVAPLYFDYDPGSYVVNILFTLTSD